MTKNKIKVCYVLCYKDPNYTRTASLLSALALIKDIELTVVKNKHKGVLRYIEMPLRLAKFRLGGGAQTYIVGFRGHEIFWALYPCMRKSRIIFDEFINMRDWLVTEHGMFRDKSIVMRLLDRHMQWIVGRCDYILTDTEAHRQLAASEYKLGLDKIKAIPVGADETLFQPTASATKKEAFEVFFYGNMLPLHGIDVILEAARILSDHPRIHFTLVGGKNSPMVGKVEDFIKADRLEKTITYIPWLTYEEIPLRIAKADLCLGGPFGGTSQAQRVISGKVYQFIAMAKPTVVGINDDSLRYFTNKQDALLVTQANPQALAAVILWGQKNQPQLKQIGTKAEKLYQKSFSSKAVAKLLEEIIF